MKRAAAVVVSIALIGVGLGVAAAAAPAGSDSRSPAAAPSATSAVDWGRCADPFLRDLGIRCAMLDVPLDYGDPTGPQIQIALSRLSHQAPDDEFQGITLVNPGGPGGSGLGLSALGAFIPDPAGDPYDWIGFDPRGVGSSEPAISCKPNYFRGPRPPYVPKNEEIESQWLARSERYANACEEHAAELLPHMTTINAARDIDSIRVALGMEQINYYGFSYGTYLGQVYATLFPGRIRRAVFDSNVDPTRVFYQANLDQDYGFDRNLRIWFAWLAEHHDVYRLGRTEAAVTRAYLDTERALRRHPAGGVIGSAEWADALLGAAYCDCLWADLGDVFSSWVHDQKERKLIRAYEGAVTPGYDNGYAMYLAVQCVDAPWPTDWDTWRTDNWAVHEDAPLSTWSNAWFNAPCFFWAAEPGVPVTVNGGTTEVLLIGATLDAATAYEYNLVVRSLFPNSVLIAVTDETTHAPSGFGNACIDDPIIEFFATGTLPPRLPGSGPDVVCDQLPPPEPRVSTRLSRADDRAAGGWLLGRR
jgi:pimeloyl-ACP methyl ester carboxylesterase